LLRAANVARLAAFIAATQQDHNLTALKSVIDPQARTKRNSHLKHPTAHRLAIAEVSSAHPSQTGVRRRAHFLVGKGIKPPIKQDKSVLKFQLLDYLLDYVFECNL